MTRRSRPPTSPALAAASSAVAAVLGGDRRSASVLAAFPSAVYLEHADGVLAIVTADGVQQPNAVVLTQASADRPLAAWHEHARVTVGGGSLAVVGHEVVVTRWFDPVPRLQATAGPVLSAQLVTACDHLALVVDAVAAELTLLGNAVVEALARGDVDGAVTASRALVGRGAGLTPAGDDLLGGLFAGTIALASAVAGSAADTLVGVVRKAGAEVAERARGVTTALSASLLAHAARGEVAAPAAAVLQALTGRGQLPEALDGLLAVGSTSGRDLALGLCLGAELVLATAAPRAA